MNELQKRLDAFIFAGLKVIKRNAQQFPTQYSITVRFNPPNFGTLGLVKALENQVKKKVFANQEWQDGYNPDKI